jgi:hypothetical protein
MHQRPSCDTDLQKTSTQNFVPRADSGFIENPVSVRQEIVGRLRNRIAVPTDGLTSSFLGNANAAFIPAMSGVRKDKRRPGTHRKRWRVLWFSIAEAIPARSLLSRILNAVAAPRLRTRLSRRRSSPAGCLQISTRHDDRGNGRAVPRQHKLDRME